MAKKPVVVAPDTLFVPQQYIKDLKTDNVTSCYIDLEEVVINTNVDEELFVAIYTFSRFAKVVTQPTLISIK